MIRRMDIAGRGFNRFELADEHKHWQATLIYDPDKIKEGGEKCLDALARAKNIPAEYKTKMIKAEPIYFQVISYGGAYRIDQQLYDFTFASSLGYYQLIDIFGLNADQELDISNPTEEQELDVCKVIMKDLWAECKRHFK